jgi:DNA-binding GntR family transcriptional regulator
MSGPAPLRPASTVDQLADALRARILDGELPPGRRLVERELVEAYDVARHTLRAALRRLEAEGLVRVEPNRGARVADLSRDDLVELFALRLALEREAAHLALERGGGRLPPAVHDAAQRLNRLAQRRRTSWNELSRAHESVHRGLVAAAGAPRIERAYGALSTEIALFLSSLRPVWTRERLGPDHFALVRDLERDGPDVLREHMAQALRVLAPGADPPPPPG